jgi:asparagine synthase (glutamine-hydrolysing)
MCGIFGSVGQAYDHGKVCQSMYHRGPDEQDEFRENNVQFSHLRLSILDLTHGKQPMQYLHYTIVFNGEIYNHDEVRALYGYECKTRSDTETLLHHFHNRGIDGLHDLDGMFAMAIYDHQKKELTLMRDRAGKKPLYFYADNNSFVFSSELKTLQHILPLSIDEMAIDSLLQLGFFLPDATPFKNVMELQPGGFLVVDTQTLKYKQGTWWQIADYYKKRNPDTLSEAVEKVDCFLHKSVKDRIESSDLEVGVFLSGGIDSGIVAATAAQYKQKLKTFTVSFEGEFNEAPLAKLVAEKYNTDHNEIQISFDNLENDIEKILAGYGEPFTDPSAIPSYYVSKEAKKYVTVILNGDGADELFAGYRRYVPYSKFDFFKNKSLVATTAKIIKPFLPVSHNKKSKYNYLYRLMDIASRQWPHNYFSATIDTFLGYEKYLVRNSSAPAEMFAAKMKHVVDSDQSGLQKIMQLDFENILSTTLLVKMDIATMLNSLEGRSPLLSKYMLEYAPGLPDDFKIRNNTTKYLLREVSKKYLPPVVVSQPKRGFEIPLRSWLSGQLKEMVSGYVGSNNAYCKNFVKPQFIQNLINQDDRIPAEKRTKMLWTLFALEVWHRNLKMHN